LIASDFDDGLSIATKKSIELLGSSEATMQDIAQFGKFQNDARVGLDLQPKFATTNITNTNAQQSNEQLVINKVYADNPN